MVTLSRASSSAFCCVLTTSSLASNTFETAGQLGFDPHARVRGERPRDLESRLHRAGRGARNSDVDERHRGSTDGRLGGSGRTLAAAGCRQRRTASSAKGSAER
jgi:hypothetical protein